MNVDKKPMVAAGLAKQEWISLMQKNKNKIKDLLLISLESNSEFNKNLPTKTCRQAGEV